MKRRLSIYHQTLSLLWQFPLLFISLIGVSFAVSLTEGLGVGLLLPWLTGAHLDLSFLNNVPGLSEKLVAIDGLSVVDRLRIGALILILIMLTRSGLLYLSRLQALRLQIRVTSYLQTNLIQQCHEVAISFLQQQRMGELLERLIQHANQTSLLLKGVAEALVNLFTILTYGLLLAFISWPLTLISAGFALSVALLVGKNIFPRIRDAAMLRKEFGQELKSTSVETLSAMRLIRLFAQEPQSLARFDQVLTSFHTQFYQANKLVSLSQPLFNLFSALFLALLLMTSTFLMPIRPDAWIEQSILFAVITLRLTGPVSLLNQTQALINNFSPALRSLLDFIDRTDKPYLKNGSVPFEVIQTGITLQNVHFHYTTAGLPALENVTFHIPKNRITAIVGPSGAGKSTLVNLLTRLYDCNAGRILIDENDLHDLEVRSWRSQIAVVSQDNFLFNDTVTANIRFARNNATDQEIVAAAKLAQAHDFIISLPQGYDTVLGDRGVRLSGGQQQRLAIARAMLVDPQFVIFDEATSDLDSLTEQAIQEAIEHYSRGRTTLVIAHRLSTIRRADNIVVLDQGRVVEQGTHAQLMQLAGYYRQLVQTQYLGEAGFVDAVYSRS